MFTTTSSKDTSSVSSKKNSNNKQSSVFRNTNSAEISPSISNNLTKHPNYTSQSAQLCSLIPNSSIQTKLKIGQPNDRFEQEADQTAEKVLTSPLPGHTLQRQQQEEEEVQAKPMIQKQGEEEEEIQAKPMIQKQGEEEEEVQTKPMIQKQGEEETIRKKGDDNGSDTMALQSRLKNTEGSGEPLSESAKSYMEPRFNRDFSGVRVHTDSNAVQMSQQLNAQAFTHGSNIFFNEGKYDSGSSQGKRLLAHELTHTVQQGASSGLHGSIMTQPESEIAEAPASEEIDLEAELAKSEQEAVAAIDPIPAEKAEEEAQKENLELKKEETKEKDTGKENKGLEKPVGEKVQRSKKAIPDTKGESEKEEMPKGLVGQDLDERSAGVCGQAAAKTQVLADNEQTHDKPEQKLEQTENAVKPPEKEGQAQSNADQVNMLDKATAPLPNEADAKNTLNVAIDQSVPKKISQINEFKSKGKAKVIGNRVLGKVKKDTESVQSTYNKIEQTPPPKQLEKMPDELPEVEIAPETPKLALGKNAVPSLKEEHTDFSEFDQQSDELIKKEGISEEQINMVDEGDLFEAKKERQSLKQNVQEQPAQLQEFAQQEVQKVDQEMQAEEGKSRAAMQNKRRAGLGETKEKQKKTKTALELKREAVTKEINSIYETAKASVTTKLNNLEKQSLASFDRGQEKASREFESEVKRDVDRWKRKRYSGFWGPAKWLKDAVVGIDDFPEVKQAFESAKANYIVKIDQSILDITKDNNQVIKECKEELANARKEIKKFVDGLGPELKSTGQQAMAEMKTKLDAMDSFIEKKKGELAKALCDKKEEAIKKIDEKIEKMKEEMSGALSKLGNLLLEAAIKFFKWALKKAGYDEKTLMGIINKGKAVIKKIVGDPIGFIGNLINAVKLGIKNFQNNIKKHLIGGLIGWLTGAMGDIGIQLPAKFDLKGIISIVLQILGLTWNVIRQKLVKRLGEKVVSRVEKTVDIVKRIVTEGPMALWEMIKEKAVEIKQQVMEGIRNWAIVELVKQGIIKLLSFLNPAGAIVQAVLAIYNTIMFFVENWKRIVEFVKTVFNSIGDIAMGKIGAAASAVERAMAMTIPIILNFLARLLNLSGIGKAVKKIIMKIRAPIDKVVNKTIDFIVKKAKKLFRKGKAAVKKGVEKVKEFFFPKITFKARKEGHTISATKSGKKHDIVINSPGYKVIEFITKYEDKSPTTEVKKDLKILRTQYDKWNKMEEHLPKPKRKKEKAYSPIAKLIIKIMQKNNPEDLPLTKAVWSWEPTFDGNEKRATKVVVDPLTEKGDEGSRPTESIPGWDTKIKAAKFRVHLLHEKLHGPGTAKNLIAASQTTNARLLGSVERFELKAVKEQKIIQHEVNVSYESDPKPDWKKDVAKRIDAKARDKETGAVIGSYAGDNY